MSNIQWTDETWNPVTGCTKVSQGCKNCYAEKLAPRVFAGQTVRERFSPINDESSYRARPRRFTDVRTHADRLSKPLGWRKPRRVFVNSMSDLFHEDVPDAFIDRVFAIMALAPRHTFQVLTKRPERMRGWFDGVGGVTRMDFVRSAMARVLDTNGRALPEAVWPLPNVWLGTSVEDQRTADRRVPLLLRTPAAVRFISAEPLLGPVNLRALQEFDDESDYTDALTGERPAPTPDRLDWVIVGGESGLHARSCRVGWIEDIVRDCKMAGVPVFVKQLGARPVENGGVHRVIELADRKGGDPDEWPEALRVREWPAPT